MEYIESIIIGAGPCGLSASIEQKKVGIDNIVIEKGNVVEAIYNYPTHQTFFSTSEKLGIGDVPFIVEDHKPKRNQALVYYREVVKYHQLNIHSNEAVLKVEKRNHRFIVSTDKTTYECSYVTVATGYYGQHNTLDIPGDDLPKVHHYFKEAHPYFDKDVVIIGGKNSAIDAAIELEKAGARVTAVYRGSTYSKSVKPWILPLYESLVNHEKIKLYFNSSVTSIDNHTVTISTPEGVKTIKNDTVFAMIGYHPDYAFLESMGITLITNTFGTAPYYNRETMETNVENLYIAGVIAAGNDANTIFIENGKFHGGLIAEDIVQKKNIK
ncbi:YpdA family putative bacillithiol disulfide reductase [Macrococcoides caseolyticum]|uniref:YpdA family putative bacillithiol disulfide reductase n=1 Tax=Macrococcoides caseolyticum TaxID=69966 RepID=UPI001F3A18D7|nr:YpdA family putative bacillithiol disulfide reductase [Macrococcus caseolyticus]MCE4957082.1 YpdA family putative bacillithiol disulfide reductase [Macrococcus caseolyticus]